MNSRSVDEDEISLSELFTLLWSRRRFILVVTLTVMIVAGVAALLLPKKYEASVLVSIVTSQSSDTLSSLGGAGSGLGALASMAGLSIGVGGSEDAEAMAILQSEALTERYMKENNLLKILYAEKWDALSVKWNVDDPEKVPTLWKAYRYFDKRVRTVEQDKTTGLVTVTVTWTDPVQAAKWANGLVAMTNDYMRQRVIDESERNLKYLGEQAVSTEMVGMQTAIYSLMESEIKKAMLARGTYEYALKILDPAAVPEKESSPKIFLWLLMGLLIGGFVATFTAVLAGSKA